MSVSGGMYRSIAEYAAAITPSDTANLDAISAVYVGGDGNISCLTAGGDTVTFVGLVAGSILPVAVKRVNSTSTTATNLVALW